MTPAINAVKQAKVEYKIHEYTHDPAGESYGLEAANKMGVSTARVFKTLIVQLDHHEFAVGIVPVSSMLSMKRISRTLGVKKAAMAFPLDVERLTGYVVGGVSPLGQRKRLPIIIDISATAYPTIFVSAGRRGLQIELAPDDLKKVVSGKFAELCQ